MARHRGGDWDLPTGNDANSQLSWEHVQVAVLMDLRDELKGIRSELAKLNGLLNCPNFTTMPATVRNINRKLRDQRKPRALKRAA